MSLFEKEEYYYNDKSQKQDINMPIFSSYCDSISRKIDKQTTFRHVLKILWNPLLQTLGYLKSQLRSKTDETDNVSCFLWAGAIGQAVNFLHWLNGC